MLSSHKHVSTACTKALKILSRNATYPQILKCCVAACRIVLEPFQYEGLECQAVYIRGDEEECITAVMLVVKRILDATKHKNSYWPYLPPPPTHGKAAARSVLPLPPPSLMLPTGPLQSVDMSQLALAMAAASLGGQPSWNGSFYSEPRQSIPPFPTWFPSR